MGPRATDIPMRSPLVGAVVAYVRASGGDADGLIRAFDLSPTVESDSEATLPLSTMQAFYDAAERAAADPFLGLHVASSLQRGAYGLVEFLCRSASTLREALDRIVRYISLLNDVVDVRMVDSGAESSVEQRIPGRPLCVGRHGNEFFVASLVLQARALSGIPVVPTRVWLAHPRPHDVSDFAEALGIEATAIAFGAGANGLAVSSGALDLPVLSADEALHGLLRRQADQSLAHRASAPTRFVGRVAEIVRRGLDEGGPPALESAAGSLRMSPRTLQRRLAEHGTGYQQVVDLVREELARLWIADARVGLADMALRLGYSDETAFLRAFKRWTGTTPARIRHAPAG